MTAKEALEKSKRFEIINRNEEIKTNLRKVMWAIDAATEKGERTVTLFNDLVENNTLTWLIENEYTVIDIAEDKYRWFYGTDIYPVETKTIISW